MSPRPPTDVLARAIEHVRPHLDPALPIGERIRNFWAGVVASRELAASEMIEAKFLPLAHEVGLAGELGRHAEEDLRHVIRWAMLDQNPFG
jgi:hypothetical protein